MKVLALSEFYSGNYVDRGYDLYVVRDTAERVMYVGISRESVWNRWFGGTTSHFEVNDEGKLIGASYIGQVIEQRLPNSWQWKIELWTKKELAKKHRNEIQGDRLKTDIDIEAIEQFLISKLEPLYNVMHGGGRQEDPLLTNDLDDAYRGIFG